MFLNYVVISMYVALKASGVVTHTTHSRYEAVYVPVLTKLCVNTIDLRFLANTKR